LRGDEPDSYILENLVGVERRTDYLLRESLILHFSESEPVCILLIGSRGETNAEEWLTEDLESEDGKWGACETKDHCGKCKVQIVPGSAGAIEGRCSKCKN
jgi:hypothetical protein